MSRQGGRGGCPPINPLPLILHGGQRPDLAKRRNLMAAPAKVAVVDADAHVVESAQTWEYLDPEDRKHRPVPLEVQGDTPLQYWLVDGKVRGFRFPAYSTAQLEGLSRLAGRTMATPEDASEVA